MWLAANTLSRCAAAHLTRVEKRRWPAAAQRRNRRKPRSAPPHVYVVPFYIRMSSIHGPDRTVACSLLQRPNTLGAIHQIASGQAAVGGNPSVGVEAVRRTEEVVYGHLWHLRDWKFPAAVRTTDDISERNASAGAMAGGAGRRRRLVVRAALHLRL